MRFRNGDVVEGANRGRQGRPERQAGAERGGVRRGADSRGRGGDWRGRGDDSAGGRSGEARGRAGEGRRGERSGGEGQRQLGGDWVNSKREGERVLSPLIPDEITANELEIGVRAQLKTLTIENAEKVARHLVMVGLLLDQDPELAHEHAKAAVARAGRIAVVREFYACTAYAVGDFALALRELLTHRRISGSNEQIALIADCERGMGRPERALEVGRSVDRATLTATTRVNLAIALSGARLDLGQTQQALIELEIRELDETRVFEYSPPLFYAYAEVLGDLGRAEDARRWIELAQRAEAALAAKSDAGDTLVVLEELEIPKRRVWVDQAEWERTRPPRTEDGRRGDGRGGARGDVRGDGRGGARGDARGDARGGARGDVRNDGRGGARGDARTASRGDSPRGATSRQPRDDYRPRRGG